MKFVIRDVGQSEEAVFLAYWNGEVTLQTEKNYIATLRNDGTLFLHNGVVSDHLQVDKGQHIKVVKE